jgi:NAD+ synthase (glutamine-hydrolysing)
MAQYLEDKLASTPVAKWIGFYGLDDPSAFIEDLEWVAKQVSGSVFKRIQMPPTIAVVRDTTSFDFRENQVRFEQTDEYRMLKEQILSMEH